MQADVLRASSKLGVLLRQPDHLPAAAPARSARPVGPRAAPPPESPDPDPPRTHHRERGARGGFPLPTWASTAWRAPPRSGPRQAPQPSMAGRGRPSPSGAGHDARGCSWPRRDPPTRVRQSVMVDTHYTVECHARPVAPPPCPPLKTAEPTRPPTGGAGRVRQPCANAVVTEYIGSAQPVGSAGTVVDAPGVLGHGACRTWPPWTELLAQPPATQQDPNQQVFRWPTPLPQEAAVDQRAHGEIEMMLERSLAEGAPPTAAAMVVGPSPRVGRSQ